MEDHNIAPVYDENSRVLVLGSFPSVRSREQKFFYGHPHNRFWKVLALVFEEKVPENIDEKKNLLLGHNIALWDVIASCDIDGSSDSSIKNVAFNDLSQILSKADVRAVVLNGKTAETPGHLCDRRGVGLPGRPGPVRHRLCDQNPQNLPRRPLLP